jgi:hypothetical protein
MIGKIHMLGILFLMSFIVLGQTAHAVPYSYLTTSGSYPQSITNPTTATFYVCATSAGRGPNNIASTDISYGGQSGGDIGQQSNSTCATTGLTYTPVSISSIGLNFSNYTTVTDVTASGYTGITYLYLNYSITSANQRVFIISASATGDSSYPDFQTLPAGCSVVERYNTLSQYSTKLAIDTAYCENQSAGTYNVVINTRNAGAAVAYIDTPAVIPPMNFSIGFGSLSNSIYSNSTAINTLNTTPLWYIQTGSGGVPSLSQNETINGNTILENYYDFNLLAGTDNTVCSSGISVSTGNFFTSNRIMSISDMNAGNIWNTANSLGIPMSNGNHSLCLKVTDSVNTDFFTNIVNYSVTLPNYPNVTIRINNTRGTDIPANFSQEIKINKTNSAFQNISSNDGNVRFMIGNTPLYSWSQDSNGDFWVKLPNGIPANSALTMNIVVSRYGDFDGIYAGTNAHIATNSILDNGARVFPFYDSFINLNLTKWTDYNILYNITANGILVNVNDSGMGSFLMTNQDIYPGNVIDTDIFQSGDTSNIGLENFIWHGAFIRQACGKVYGTIYSNSSYDMNACGASYGYLTDGGVNDTGVYTVYVTPNEIYHYFINGINGTQVSLTDTLEYPMHAGFQFGTSQTGIGFIRVRPLWENNTVLPFSVVNTTVPPHPSSSAITYMIISNPSHSMYAYLNQSGERASVKSSSVFYLGTDANVGGNLYVYKKINGNFSLINNTVTPYTYALTRYYLNSGIYMFNFSNSGVWGQFNYSIIVNQTADVSSQGTTGACSPSVCVVFNNPSGSGGSQSTTSTTIPPTTTTTVPQQSANPGGLSNEQIVVGVIVLVIVVIVVNGNRSGGQRRRIR